MWTYEEMQKQPWKIFDRVETWVFDLDNTLYPASSGLFKQVSQRMTGYISEYFNISREEALERQRFLFEQYGTTLRGLMTDHCVDPQQFLDHVHKVDYGLVNPHPELALKLAQLPGRKLIFTNSSRNHAYRVMERLGITEHFAEVFDIADADYIPKPGRECYAMLLDRHSIQAATACMIDDIPANLEPAKALGMKTVWLKRELISQPDPAVLSQIDWVAENLVDWLDGVLSHLEDSNIPRIDQSR